MVKSLFAAAPRFVKHSAHSTRLLQLGFDTNARESYVVARRTFMADNISTPGGALPPRPAEAAKVQPKKETVRINLPPKPTSAPTIKLPTLAPGSAPPAAGLSAAAPVAAAAPASSKAPAPPTPPPAGAPARMTSSVPKQPVQTAPAAAPPPRPAVYGLSGLDKGLAIAAAVVGLASVGVVVYLVFILKDTVPS